MSFTPGMAPGVLCHGNPHLNNVLNGGDKQVWLIGGDNLVLGSRERDLRSSGE